jgi:hypothetical protein
MQRRYHHLSQHYCNHHIMVNPQEQLKLQDRHPPPPNNSKVLRTIITKSAAATTTTTTE